MGENLRTMIGQYLDFGVKVFAYGVGYALLAIAYLLSIVFPPLRKLICEYETSSSTRSKLIIAIIAAIVIAGTIVYLNNISNVNYTVTEIIVSGLGFFALGYYALVMLFEHKRRKLSVP